MPIAPASNINRIQKTSDNPDDYKWATTRSTAGVPRRMWPTVYWTQAEYEAGYAKAGFDLRPTTAADRSLCAKLLKET